MIQIVVIKNPFNPANGREIHTIAYEEGKTIAYYTDLYIPVGFEQKDMIYVVNGYTVEPTKTLFDGAFLVMSPQIAKGHKNPFLLIASIALSVVAMGAGAAVAGVSTLGAASGWAAIGGYLTAGAIMYVGGKLLNHWAGGDKVGYGKEKTQNPTYSWSGITTTEGQGNAIPITYGTVKSGGQTLNKFVTTRDDKQYLSWLIAAGEGPLSIHDIEINKNPASYFQNVQVETRSGVYNQGIIGNFGDTISTMSMGLEITESWRTYDLSGDATEGIIISIEFSNGLYHVKNNGDLENAWCDIDIQYKKQSDSTWLNFSKKATGVSGVTIANNGVSVGTHTMRVISFYLLNSSQVRYVSIDGQREIMRKSSTKTISGFYVDGSKMPWTPGTYTITVTNDMVSGRITSSKATAVRRDFRVDYLPRGAYSVRIRVVARQYPVSSTRAASRVWWTGLSSIVYDDFTYPGIGLVGVKALATDQLSGSPSITFLKTRSTVPVYNPTTKKYESKDATNPAWAAYDYIHRGLDLYGDLSTIYVDGAPAELIMYDKFADWAAWCDKKDLHINIEINEAGDLLETVNSEIAAIGHGRVVLFGIKFGCTYDAPVDYPVQMFTMGNIISGSFEEEFSQTSDRANAVEITFTNADKDYERDTITVYGADYDKTDAYNQTTAITVNGITDYKQAYRYGKFQLACNQRLIRICKFKASIDAIACTVGDVISIAHDVPEWACSGHITAVDGDTVTLGAIFDNYDSSATYRIQYRVSKSDTLYTANLSSITITDDGVTATLASVSAEAPEVGDIADIAKATIGSKLFTVKTITRSNDGEYTRTITALEYSAAVYDENYSIPDINYSTATEESGDIKNVTDLTGRQVTWKDSSGTKHQRLYLTWKYPDNTPYTRFDVFLSSTLNGYYTLAGSTTGMYFETDTVVGESYYVKVVTVGSLRQSTGTVTKVDIGTDMIPNNVDKLNVEKLASGIRRYWWDFVYPNPNDIAGFRMKYTQGTELNWETGIPVQEGLITVQPYETQTVRQGMHAIMIKAVDNSGNESEKFAYCLLDMGDLLQENVLWSKNFSENGWADVEENGWKDVDGYLYPKDTTLMWRGKDEYRWASAEGYAWANNWLSYTVLAHFTAPASGQMWLKYDIEGPAIVYYREVLTDAAWTGEDDAAWTDEDEATAPDDEIWKQYSDRVIIEAGAYIEVKVVTLNNSNEKTVVKDLEAFIDVPDRNEHFENLYIDEGGVKLPIVTPNYHTTSVHIDAVQGDSSGTILQPIIMSRNPCIIRLVDQNGNKVAGTVDISWQGFVEELLS